MLHESVAEYLGSAVEGLAYSESEGGNVFIDRLPTEPDRAVAVYTAPGAEASSLHGYDPVAFQVIVRSEPDGVWARLIWQRVYSALHGLEHTTLPGGVHVVYILAEQASPLNLGDDAASRIELSTDFRAETVNVTEHRGA